MILTKLKTYYRSVLLVICIITVFCITYNYNKSTQLQRYHFLHFGTTIQITLSHNEQKLSKDTIDQIDNLLKNLHYKWHPWREGELKKLNANLSTLTPFTATSEIISVIQLSQDLYNKSLGYFNPAIGKLVAYWGFHNDNPIAENQQTNINLINLKKNLPNPNHIKINNTNNIVQNTNAYLQLDLSGFIKADAALKIKDILINKNIFNALINIGGDIYIMGHKAQQTWHENKQPWIIATNLSNNSSFSITVNNNESIATSGINARKYSEFKNQTPKLRHHIINPNTGEPALGFTEVTVIHSDPFLCDAAATALLIAGETEYEKVAQSMGITKYILANKTTVIISDEIKQNIVTSTVNK